MLGTALDRVHGWVFHRRINPILLKEIRTIFKGNRFFIRHFALLILCSALLTVAAVGLSSSFNDGAPTDLGRQIFLSTQIAQLVLIGIVVPAITATGITSEREALTHEMLLTTGMTASAIVRGKFLHAMTVTLVMLTSFLPFVGMSFLYGGVAASQLIRNFIFLLVVAAFCASYSLAFSALANKSQVAVGAAYLWTFVVASAAAGALDEYGYSRIPAVLAEYGFLPKDYVSLRYTYESYASWEISSGWILLYVYALPLFCIGSIVAFAMLLAVNSLKPSFANKTTNMKIFYALFVLIGGVLLLISRGTPDREVVIVHFILLAGLATLSTLFAMEGLVPPLHIRQAIDRLRGEIVGMIKWWVIFYPGSVNGFWFCSIVNGLVIGGSALFLSTLGSASPYSASRSTILCSMGVAAMWAFFCAALGFFLSVLFFNRRRARIILFAIIVILLTCAPLVHYGIAHRQMEKAAFDFGLSPITVFVATYQDHTDAYGSPYWVHGYRVEFASSIIVVFICFYGVAAAVLFVVASSWSRRIRSHLLGAR